MSAYTWAARPNGLVSHRGNGAMEELLEVLRGAWEVVAFAYRLRTGHGVRGAGSAAR
ncbi:MAG: hypothetical protein ACJ8GN_12430 [Longimicrobiaceae bacterium]